MLPVPLNFDHSTHHDTDQRNRHALSLKADPTSTAEQQCSGMADSVQKEAFRKYLESAGVIDALTKGAHT